MKIRLVVKILGSLLLFLSAALLAPIPFGLIDKDGSHYAFILSVAVGIVAGIVMIKSANTRDRDLGHREGFAVVTFGWLIFGILGALPYWLSGHIPGIVDAVFESLSGFTTTGATILTDIESLPRSLLFWRATTHWLGGMGIIVLSLAILPMLGVGGMQLFKAEVPGPTADRLSPRIQDTAKLLWSVYVGLTGAEVGLLMFGGMDFFDAVCHSFATLATGGFSTRNASIGAFNSAYIDWIITLFMLLAGINFALHYTALAGNPLKALRNEELRTYFGIAVVATLVIMAANFVSTYDTFAENLRYSAFQAVAILTTTGFGTADYEMWPFLCQLVLFFLMFVGGSAGSTGGGAKVSRLLLIVKHAGVQVWGLLHPRAIRRVKLDGRPVPEEVLQAILGFFALYIGCTAVATLVIAGLGVDPLTSLASVVACIGNIGPGLGNVGPSENFAHLPEAGKVILTFCMLLGRLELFTVLVLFFPSCWRK